MSTLTIIIVGVAILLFLLLLGPSIFFSVKQQTNVIIERFGKFHRIANPGLGMKVPFIDKKAGISNLRIQQIDMTVETKTEDNVFVEISVSVQYQVNPDRVYDAFYKLSNHQQQITSYVYDSIRSSVPALVLDDVFQKKDDIAREVANAIGAEMGEFGYVIVKTLISDVNPNAKVKESMNNINAAQRERVAAQELANAEKIKTVTNAEAKAEAQRLQGVGIASQRKEIINGFSASIDELKDKEVNTEDVVHIILFTQYLETIASLGEHGASSILLPGGPGGMRELYDEVQLGTVTGGFMADNLNKQPATNTPKSARGQRRQVIPELPPLPTTPPAPPAV